MNALLWGLVADDSFDSICTDRGGIAEVTATTTPLEALVTAVTLGILAPIEVHTRCLAIGANDAKR